MPALSGPIPCSVTVNVGDAGGGDPGAGVAGALGVADESRAAGIAGVAEGLATESGRCGARSEPFAQPAIVSTMSASNATQARVVMRRSSRVNALRQSVRRIVCFRDVDPLRSGSGSRAA